MRSPRGPQGGALSARCAGLKTGLLALAARARGYTPYYHMRSPRGQEARRGNVFEYCEPSVKKIERDSVFNNYNSMFPICASSTTLIGKDEMRRDEMGRDEKR